MKSEVRVPINSGADILTARLEGRQLASEAGFNNSDLTVIATAISEVARNIVQYARTGEIILGVVQDGNKRGLRVEARDDGPGIPNIELAMQDGYSTGGGLGLGLPGTRRLMDELQIDSKVGRGTTVVATKWIR
ncbi:MAG: ATP-binding protein [Acidobacteria bacterium]|nr:MAG: ATP-binding protein [Acidobacteriota bacterium]